MFTKHLRQWAILRNFGLYYGTIFCGEEAFIDE
jgi:hypothetical protein